MSADDQSQPGERESVGYPEPFAQLAVELCESALRQVAVLSPALDPQVFDRVELVTALSALARRGRQSEIRILVQAAGPIVQRGHRLLELVRRLPSALRIQVLPHHPEWKDETLVIRDRDGMLYKPGDSDQRGFYQPDSVAQVSQHLDHFNELWRRSAPDINFRSLPL